MTIWGYSPIEYLQVLNPKNAIDVVNSPSPTINATIVRLGERGEVVVRAMLVKTINSLLDFFNIGKTMNDSQIVTTINLIISDYSVLKMDDFILCFRRAMQGKYGKVYDRIDGEIIFEWLEQYLFEKANEVEAARSYENKIHKEESAKGFLDMPTTTPMPEWFTIPEKKRPQIKSLETRSIQSDEQRLMNGYINRFDKLWKAQKLKVKGGRFARFAGRILNVEDFLHYKVVVQPEKVSEYLNKRSKRKQAA